MELSAIIPMNSAEIMDWTAELLRKRQQTSPKRLINQGPDAAQVDVLFEAAAQAPDHGLILPWRFIQISDAARPRLGEAFAAALLERDPFASPQQLQDAHDKAQRAPFLALALARTRDDHPEIPLAERFVSLGCALQNLLLAAHAQGFGAGLVRGQAMGSEALRGLFDLGDNEQAVCFVVVGTVKTAKPARIRSMPVEFVTSL